MTLILAIDIYRRDYDMFVRMQRTVYNQTALCPCEVGSMATQYLTLHNIDNVNDSELKFCLLETKLGTPRRSLALWILWFSVHVLCWTPY